jgi:hypothetical protein
MPLTLPFRLQPLQAAPGSSLLQQLFSGQPQGTGAQAGARIEFGASQAILVRDELAKRAVQSQVGAALPCALSAAHYGQGGRLLLP